MFGPPGVGKSTLCDPIWDHRAIGWDGKLPPKDWQPFLDEVTRLFGLIQNHWSFSPAVRMNRRSVKKMATVARMESDRPYIQTGLVQRGLGFGWRLHQMGADLNELRAYFQLVPVSIGVASLWTDRETLLARNRARLTENRDYQVLHYEAPRLIAIEELKNRGVPFIEVDTGQPVEQARQQLIDLAGQEPFDREASGPRSQVEVLQAPPWWG